MTKFKYYSIWLCVICVIVFILQSYFEGFTDFFVLLQSNPFDFWRFISAIFLHGSLLHLVYNLFALGLFGSILEHFIGPKKFVSLFLLSGIFANLISVFFYPSSLGASGAIFGVIAALAWIKPKMTVFAFGLPMPLFLAGAIWVGGDIIGAAAFISGNPMDNTGNIAHLAGAVFGIIFGIKFRKEFSEEKNTSNNSIQLDERYMRSWEDSFLK